jgi:hypothetical protein
MSGKSSEQVSFGIIKGLEPRDRRLVREWVDRTGCDWTTALLNSGVMGSGHRRTPEQDARDAARREADEALETWLQLVSPPDSVARRREASEHEAAHSVTAQALGSTVSVATISTDGSGLCRYSVAGLTDLHRAAVMLAPKVWLETFRTIQFPRGASGTAQDRRDAAATGADLRQATQLAFEILRDNRAAVIQLADKIDADGHWIPPAG